MRLHFALFAAAAVLVAAPVQAAQPSAPVAADPAKAALANRVAAAIWPDGTYGRMVDSMFGGKDGLSEMILDMRPADLMGALGEAMGPDATAELKEGAAPSQTFRQMLTAEDPYFEERMRIMTRVVGEEVRRIARPIEPKFRAGLAKSIERRFTREQLEPIAAFFESDAGRAYAAQSMTMFMDEEVMLAMVNSLPLMIKEMPAAFKKVETATAHLPKPPKKEPAKDSEQETEEETEEEPSTE